MAKYHGKNTKIEIATVAIGCKSFKFKDGSDNADTTDTESSGKKGYTAGLAGGDWSIEIEIDPATFPVASVQAGLTPAVKLYLNRTDAGKFINMPATMIDDVDYDAPVDGIVKATITGKTNGTYTLPT